MKIIKIQKSLLNNLIRSENLLEEIKENDLIEKRLIENLNNENIEIYDIKFEIPFP